MLLLHVIPRYPIRCAIYNSSATTILLSSFQHLSSLLPGYLDIKALNIIHQEIIRISTEIILDESSEVRIQIQQHVLLIPLRPVGEELAGPGVGVESVDEG